MMMMITSRHQGEDQEYQMNGVEGEADEIQTSNQNCVAPGFHNIWLITDFVFLLQWLIKLLCSGAAIYIYTLYP